MAITAATRKSIIDLAVGAYNAAPGTTLLSALVAESDAGKSLAEIATIITTSTAFNAIYPSFQTSTEFGEEFLSNLIPNVADRSEGVTIIEGMLAAGSTRADVLTLAVNFLAALPETDANLGVHAALFNNKVEVATHHTVTLEQADQSATAISGVTSDDASVTVAKDALGGGAGTGGATYTLTSGTDTIAGGSGNDAINAASGTLTNGDKVTGGAGTDTLNATITGTAPAQSATSLSGVEILNLTASPNPSSISLTGVTGVTEINNLNSANGASLTVSGVGAPVNSTLTGSQSSTTIGYTTAVTGATALTDASTLTLNGVAAGSSYSAAGIDQLTIHSMGSANSLSTLSAANTATATITGDQALTLGTVGGTKLTALDASAFAGTTLTVTAGAGAGSTAKAGVTISGPTAATTTSTITAGGNQDTITLGAGTNTLVAGAGNDTITSGAGTNTITPGTGNDTITLAAGTDTIRFAEAGATNADTVNGLTATTVLAVNLGTAAVAGTSAASAGTFGTVQTGGTSPVLSNVDGTGTGTAIVLQTISPNATATTNTVAAGSNVLALNGAFTDGTAAGVVTALGTTATTGIATSSTGKFLLVTYSVGNIAQVWSYAGDTTADTNITAAELSLVATLNGVAQNTMSAANFATYLTTAAASTAVANTGQTITLSGTLNTVQSTANAAGQFLTAANDTINVGVGTMPTAAASATSGLTIIDSSSTDADVMNATVLGNWALGSIVSGIETINLNMLVTGPAFSAAAITPGTKAFGLTGSQNFTVTNLPAAATVSLGSGYTGTATAGLISDAGTADKLTVNLAGSTATSATVGANFVSTVVGVIETVTVNVSAASSIRMAGVELFGAAANVVAHNLTGSGSLNVFGAFGSLNTLVLNGSGITYTGALTLSPTTTGNMDFSLAASTVTGIDTIDLKNAPTAFAGTITLDSANGTGVTPNISYAPTAAGTIGALVVAQEGSGLADSVKVSLGSKVTAVTSINAASIETLTIAKSGTASVTLGAVSLTDGVGTQKIVVTAGGAVVANTFTADAVDTTGVTGAVTNLTLANTAGATFTGGAGATTVTGSTAADVINTGIGADTITGGGGADIINAGNGNDRITSGNDANDLLSGGAGADTFVLTGGVANLYVNSLAAAGTIDTITDFVAGTDKIGLVNTGTAVTGVTVTAVTVATAGTLAAVITAIAAQVPVSAGAAANVGLITVSAGAAAGTYVFVNDTTVAAAAIDTMVKLVGVTGTVAATDFVFV